MKNLIPLYVKLFILFAGSVTFFYAIYLAQDILMPLVFSTLMAVLLNPFVNFLTKKRVNRIVAISITLVSTSIMIAFLIFFIWKQFSSFTDELPLINEKFNLAGDQLSNWINENFNVSIKNFNDWINRKIIEGMNNSILIGNTVNTATRFFVIVLLIPVYIFLILFYKSRILAFIKLLFNVEFHITVTNILSQIRSLIHQYLIGLLIELALVSGLTAIGLAFLGIKNPILFGVLTGFLNVIPYVGVLTANVILVTIAFITRSPVSGLYVFILCILVQFIDNSFIVPKMIGSKVKINALATIVTVIVGGQLCGVSGMFLSIPVMAAFKVICDNVESLKPFGYLLSDTIPGKGVIKSWDRKGK